MLNKPIFSETKFNFAKNARYFVLGILCVILAGILIFAFFGINKSIEFTGGHSVTVTFGETIENDKVYYKHEAFLKRILKENGLKFHSSQRQGSDMETAIVLKYTGEVTDEKITIINDAIKTQYDLTDESISLHSVISKTEKGNALLWTAVAVLVILSIYCVFSLFRFNSANALASMITVLTSVILFAALVTLTRVSIGNAFWGLILFNVLFTIYQCNVLSETIRNKIESEGETFVKNDIINDTLKSNLVRTVVISAVLLILSVLLVLLPSVSIKFVGLQLLFASMASVMSTLFIFTIMWLTLINFVKFKKKVMKDEKTVENTSTQK